MMGRKLKRMRNRMIETQLFSGWMMTKMSGRTRVAVIRMSWMGKASTVIAPYSNPQLVAGRIAKTSDPDPR
jgi:hypothetical protein